MIPASYSTAKILLPNKKINYNRLQYGWANYITDVFAVADMLNLQKMYKIQMEHVRTTTVIMGRKRAIITNFNLQLSTAVYRRILAIMGMYGISY